MTSPNTSWRPWDPCLDNYPKVEPVHSFSPEGRAQRCPGTLCKISGTCADKYRCLVVYPSGRR